MQIQQVLEQVGLTSRQAKIYCAWLECGLSPASSLASNLKEKRVTVYQTLQDMVALWYAYVSTKNKVKYYYMVDPDVLLALHKKKVGALEESLPLLYGMMSDFVSKPKIEYFEWRDQLKDVFIQIIDEWKKFNKGEYLTFLGIENIDPKFDWWLENYFMKYRKTCSLRTKSIITQRQGRYTQYTKDRYDYVLVDHPQFILNQEIVITPRNKLYILFYSKGEMSAIVIHSKSVCNAQKAIFYALWDVYKK